MNTFNATPRNSNQKCNSKDDHETTSRSGIRSHHFPLHCSSLPLSQSLNDSIVDHGTKHLLAYVDYSSTPLNVVSRKPAFGPLTSHTFEEESPTSILDMCTPSPLQQHMKRLMDSSSGDLGKLVLVVDNARPLALSCQLTPKRTNRPSLRSKVLADKSAGNQSKHRPCRWNSDSPLMADKTQKELPISSSALRLPPPPFLASSPTPSPRPTSTLSIDTKPVLPSRSYLDASDHCRLPARVVEGRRNRPQRLQRRTSDSVLSRPQRKDSESGEENS